MRIRRRHALERGEFPKSMQEKTATYGKGEGAGRSRLRGRRPSPGVTDGSLIQVELIGGQSVSSGKGVDHVLRWLWYPAHLGRGVLHYVREADCTERSLVITCTEGR